MQILSRVLFLLPLLFIQSTFAAPLLDNVQRANLSRLTEPRPIEANKAIKVFANYDPGTKPYDFYKNNKEQVLGELVNHDVSMRAYSAESDGKITFVSAFVADAHKKIVVQRDYMNYKWVEVNGKSTKIGVLFRIEAQLETNKANVDLNGLFAIGLAVNQGSASGQLKVQVHGLSGEPISALIPSPADISDSSIQSALEAVAILKAKMWDSKTIVIPQELPD